MGIRKHFARLSPTERDNFLAAVLTLKNTIANPGDPVAKQISLYDQFSAIHLGVFSVNSPSASSVNTGHQGPGFCPWHREFLRRFELALQSVNPAVTLPYWDWTDHSTTETILFTENFIGLNGGANGIGGGQVFSGYFAFEKPGTGSNTTTLPPWYPATLNGWVIPPGLTEGNGQALQRYLGLYSSLTIKSDIVPSLLGSNSGATDADKYKNFRALLEAGTRKHNFIHNWVGGNMSGGASPNDLIFFLHHCNIDRLWAMWQMDGHEGNSFFPTSGELHGHNLPDPMWPWVGNLAGYSSNNITAASNIVLPDFSGEPVRHCADVISHRALGYSYDTLVTLGISLDQTGSMTGLTPDPVLSTSPDITKWDAAKQGIAALLHDCETALASAEAYVNAGIKTFRFMGGANVFTPVFPGTSGVIKNGSSFSEVQFNAAIALQTPGGATPIGAALTDTENNLVRIPYAGLPANEQRYMMFLTDGKENIPPNLISIADNSLVNTIIYAMGFGISSEVDYTTIANIANKGKIAPAGVNQVYHGGNPGTIDKFYTNSIAATIDYIPAVDPVYDLYPGEHVDTPFDITGSDDSFMITALGFDYSDENWKYCLIKPDGSQCDCDQDCESGEDHKEHSHGSSYRKDSIYRHEHDGVLVISNKRNGRITVFLYRNGALQEDWCGRWFLRVMYKTDHENMIMFMPSVYNYIYPVGAPPVSGPVYARLNQLISRRQSVRMIAVKNKISRIATQGVNTEIRKGPCTVSVNVYSRRILTADLTLNTVHPYAGNDFDAIVRLNDLAGGKFIIYNITSRLVAPAHSVGKAFTDTRVIPLKNRNKYIKRDQSGNSFDQAKFLADYETKKPGAFPIRDQLIEFKKRKEKNTFSAKITGNQFPGIYHLAVFIEGTIQRRDCQPERFMRIVSSQVALGILPDIRKSKKSIRFDKNKLIISVTPADSHSNTISPANISTPVIKINGKPVKAIHVNDFSGQHRFEFSFKNNKKKQDLPDRYEFETIDDKKLVFKKNDPISYEIHFNQHIVASDKFILK